MNEIMTTTYAMQSVELENKKFELELRFAEKLSKTQFVPKAYQGKPDDCFAAIHYGGSLGFDPIQSCQNINVINGKPGLSSQALIAVCIRFSGKNPVFEKEYGKDGLIFAVSCTWERDGKKITKRFSLDDAKRAGISGNTGWKNYPENMLEWRSAAFAARIAFPDVLAGLYTTEELSDIPLEKPLKIVNPPETPEKGVPPSNQNSEIPLPHSKTLSELSLNFIEKHTKEFQGSLAVEHLKGKWLLMNREMKEIEFPLLEQNRVLQALLAVKDEIKARLEVEEAEIRIQEELYNHFFEQLKTAQGGEIEELFLKAEQELSPSRFEQLELAVEKFQKSQAKQPKTGVYFEPGKPVHEGSNYTGD